MKSSSIIKIFPVILTSGLTFFIFTYFSMKSCIALALEKCFNLFFSVISYELYNTSLGLISNSCETSLFVGINFVSLIIKLISFTFFRFFYNNEKTDIVSLSLTILITASLFLSNTSFIFSIISFVTEKFIFINYPFLYFS